MKHMNRILALALALIMVLGLATTAYAANIEIDDGAITGATYEAYKLLNAEDLGAGKFDYTVNEAYRAALQAIVGEDATDAEIIDYIKAQDTAEETRAFADAIYAEIKNLDSDYTAEENLFTDVADGYYLIVETALGEEDDVHSLVMLDTAGQEKITVETKEEQPTSEKKVKDTNDTTGTDSEWQDSADYDIGDEVPFQITFTLPGSYASYDEYFVGIHDVQAEGLDYVEGSLKVTVGGKDITDWFDDTEETDDDCTFHIECADIVAKDKTDETVALKAGDTIVFEYKSILTEDAKFGSTGNLNEMTVEFSNNPYGDGTSETPKDTVIVFTYKVNVDKYAEAVEDGKELTGAGFTLYKEVPADTEGALTGAEIKAEFAENIKAAALDDEAYYIVACEVKTDEDGDTFGFEGVDDGTYVLVETTVPAGYNAWDAVEFEITAEHSLEGKVTNLEGGDLFAEDDTTGILDADIINNAGIELPSTGGMGTTLFYAFGGLLMAAAVVMLVTKKRMASAK